MIELIQATSYIPHSGVDIKVLRFNENTEELIR
jgi:hypothetical protein